LDKNVVSSYTVSQILSLVFRFRARRWQHRDWQAGQDTEAVVVDVDLILEALSFKDAGFVAV